VVIKTVLSLVLRSCHFELVGDMSDADYRKQTGTPNPGTSSSSPACACCVSRSFLTQ
jgi:hypothetical protein